MIVLWILFISVILWSIYLGNRYRKEAQNSKDHRMAKFYTVYMAVMSAVAVFGVGACLLLEVIPWLEQIAAGIGNIMLAYIAEHFGFFLVVGGGAGYVVYRKYHPRALKPDEPLPSPTMDTYRAVMNILRIAAKLVGPALGLAPIYEDTSIMAEADETLIQNGAYWWMKFRLPKQNATTLLDENLIRRVLQREIQVVLETENPGAFDKVRFVRGGSYECIIQIDKVHDYDAYVYVYAVIASEEYFKQRGKQGNSRGSLASRGDDGEF